MLAFWNRLMHSVLMALSYKPTDRDQLFLLPPDVRDWLPEDHLAFFVLDVVEAVETSSLHAKHPNDGAGRQAYDPEMLLAMLVYGYCTGQRSSRRIERLCEVDVAFRVIAANQRPDHSTIARFRADNGEVIERLFTDVLSLCREAGLVGLGVVAVDGTKMAADASRSANRTREQIEAAVRQMLEEAAAVDAAEDEAYGDKRGDELPEALANPKRRRAALDAALEALRQREAEQEASDGEARMARQRLKADAAAGGRLLGGRIPRAEDTIESAQAVIDYCEARQAAEFAEWRTARDAARAAGQPVPPMPNRGRASRARSRLRRLQAEPSRAPTAPRPPTPFKVNTTDPDSRVMSGLHGFLQGYNAQAAVSETGIVLAARLSTCASDGRQCQPMMEATRAELDAAGIDEPIGTMLFDAGYLSVENLLAPGPDRLIATKKSKQLRAELRREGHLEGAPPPGASPIEAMEHRLRTEEGSELYGFRQCIVEPAFGDIKENFGYRRFSRRGLDACGSEWTLICAAKNITKLFRVVRVLPA